ncbi:MAG: hypothetical protein Q7K71_04050, partial [Candidatus Omnitrophota bacterium]|nr:hypothetical protein [Candidatus Omnitrophota bacterium]
MIFRSFDLILIRIDLREDAVLDLLLVPSGKDKGVVDLTELGEVLVLVDFLGQGWDYYFTDDLTA